MYFAEFAFVGMTELASDLLIQAPSEAEAKAFAEEYASHWGLELFALSPATEKQSSMYRRSGKVANIKVA